MGAHLPTAHPGSVRGDPLPGLVPASGQCPAGFSTASLSPWRSALGQTLREDTQNSILRISPFHSVRCGDVRCHGRPWMSGLRRACLNGPCSPDQLAPPFLLWALACCPAPVFQRLPSPDSRFQETREAPIPSGRRAPRAPPGALTTVLEEGRREGAWCSLKQASSPPRRESRAPHLAPGCTRGKPHSPHSEVFSRSEVRINGLKTSACTKKAMLCSGRGETARVTSPKCL